MSKRFVYVLRNEEVSQRYQVPAVVRDVVIEFADERRAVAFERSPLDRVTLNQLVKRVSSRYLAERRVGITKRAERRCGHSWRSIEIDADLGLTPR